MLNKQISCAARMEQIDEAIERWVQMAVQQPSLKYTTTFCGVESKDKAPDPRSTTLASAIQRSQQAKDPRIMGTDQYVR